MADLSSILSIRKDCGDSTAIEATESRDSSSVTTSQASTTASTTASTIASTIASADPVSSRGIQASSRQPPTLTKKLSLGTGLKQLSKLQQQRQQKDSQPPQQHQRSWVFGLKLRQATSILNNNDSDSDEAETVSSAPGNTSKHQKPLSKPQSSFGSTSRILPRRASISAIPSDPSVNQGEVVSGQGLNEKSIAIETNDPSSILIQANPVRSMLQTHLPRSSTTIKNNIKPVSKINSPPESTAASGFLKTSLVKRSPILKQTTSEQVPNSEGSPPTELSSFDKLNSIQPQLMNSRPNIPPEMIIVTHQNCTISELDPTPITPKPTASKDDFSALTFSGNVSNPPVKRSPILNAVNSTPPRLTNDSSFGMSVASNERQPVKRSPVLTSSITVTSRVQRSPVIQPFTKPIVVTAQETLSTVDSHDTEASLSNMEEIELPGAIDSLINDRDTPIRKIQTLQAPFSTTTRTETLDFPVVWNPSPSLLNTRPPSQHDMQTSHIAPSADRDISDTIYGRIGMTIPDDSYAATSPSPGSKLFDQQKPYGYTASLGGIHGGQMPQASPLMGAECDISKRHPQLARLDHQCAQPSPASLAHAMYAPRIDQEDPYRVTAMLETRLADTLADLHSVREDYNYLYKAKVQSDCLYQELIEQTKRDKETISQLRIDIDSLMEKVGHEKLQNERHEADFRLFSHKMRSQSDRISEITAENEALKMSLRKLQFESSSPNMSNKESFYRERLDQALYDNESLRLLVSDLHVGDEDTSIHSTIASEALPISSSDSPYRSVGGARGVGLLDTRYSTPVPSGASHGVGGSSDRGDAHRFASGYDYPLRVPSSLAYETLSGRRGSGSMRAISESGMRNGDRNIASPSPFETESYGREAWPVSATSHSPLAQSAAMGSSSGSGGMGQRFATRQTTARRFSTANAHPSPIRHGEGDADRYDRRGSNAAGGSGISTLTSGDFIRDRDRLDKELRTLADEKSQLTFELSRIPANGSSVSSSVGAKGRRRLAEIEEQLDSVDRKMAAVRKQMKQMGVL
ncbi:hypothetical protein BASA60_008983 [Batrachochytrium salamandrivorans]|nr:hypothetical protein BASA60_008983 [Batrachochytrium salamandrivorans]